LISEGETNEITFALMRLQLHVTFGILYHLFMFEGNDINRVLI